MGNHIIIAVDGTAASGKGTLARKLAETYNGAWLDTGLLYRFVALKGTETSIAVKAAQDLANHFSLNMLTDESLRGETASRGASVVAAIPEVRQALVNVQKNFAQTLPEGRQCTVLDGRDIGTVIAPDAQIKFFVDADVTERAKRRTNELHSLGKSDSYEAVLEAMRQRDARDITRAVAPTIAAPDAYHIDTTSTNIPAMLEMAQAHIVAIAPELRSAV